MSGNFSLIEGDTKAITVTVKDRDGDVVDITGATINWQAAKNPHATATLTKATGGSGISITSGTGGQFRITIDAADTANLSGDFYHEAQVTFSDGTIATVLTGKMTITPALI